MLFSSVSFLFLFLPLCWAAHQPGGPRWKNGVLLVASVLFYSWGEPRFVMLMLLSVAVNYGLARRLHASQNGARRRTLFWAIVFNLGLLALFKYANFAIENLNALLEALGVTPIGYASIKLPIGISFYSFHAISYLVDIYRRNVQPNRSVAQYALYIMFFPQLVAGPIIRYKDIYDQLPRRHVMPEDLNAGALRFALGLSKKVLIANPLGLVADSAFSEPANSLSPTNAWFGLICYTLQIYFDFSGYSDMAIGLARLFGFRFPENFNYPYMARSIQEFWRRWHMSLSTWFRDYVYIPLGGNREGFAATYKNLWTVFLLTGLWHGASWNFVLWGAAHGFFLTFERFAARSASGRWQVPAVARHLYAIFAVMLSWVLFRANDLAQARDYVLALLGHWPPEAWTLPPYALMSVQLVSLAMVGALFALPTYPMICRTYEKLFETDASAQWAPLAGAATVGTLLTLDAMALAVGQYNPFIYFRF